MRSLLLLATLLASSTGIAQSSFDVASIRPSSQEVAFEHDGTIVIANGTLSMHDVTTMTCIKWAYRLQRAQVEGKDPLDKTHYDITAKAPIGTSDDQMRSMMRALLAERFGLRFHRDNKEMQAYVLTVSPRGLKSKLSADQTADAEHQNSSTGFVARHFTMDDFATYMSDPLHAPLINQTGLHGKYDLTIDFRNYADDSPDIRPDPVDIVRRALEGELGLTIHKQKTVLPTIVIDAITAPTEN